MLVNVKTCSEEIQSSTLAQLQQEFGLKVIPYLPNDTYVLLEADGKHMKGTICLDLRLIPPFICNFFVVMGHRNQGIGSGMVQEVHGKIKDLGLSMVNLACRDEKVHFYKTLGYIRTGVIPIHHDDVKTKYNLMTYYPSSISLSLSRYEFFS